MDAMVRKGRLMSWQQNRGIIHVGGQPIHISLHGRRRATAEGDTYSFGDPVSGRDPVVGELLLYVACSDGTTKWGFLPEEDE